MSFYMSRHVEREILSALIDGELDIDERRYVHEHLQECAACREAAEEFGHIHGVVVGLPRLVAPAAFVSDVIGVRQRPRARALASIVLGGKRRWVVAGSAAIAAAITLAGLVVQPAREQPPVDAFIERHVSVHTGVEPGAHVLIAVKER